MCQLGYQERKLRYYPKVIFKTVLCNKIILSNIHSDQFIPFHVLLTLTILQHLNVKHSSFQGYGLLFKKKKKGKQNKVSLAFFLAAFKLPPFNPRTSQRAVPLAEISA